MLGSASRCDSLKNLKVHLFHPAEGGRSPGKLSLRIRFRETCDVDHFSTFQLGEPCRKQDRKLRILAPHFSSQFHPCHPRHRVVRYQKVSSQSVFK